MKKMVICMAALACICVAGIAAAKEEKGKALFKQHCAVCHPDGGNIINQKKSLHRGQNSNIKAAKDIIRAMRKPGPGMTKFDEKAIPETDAKLIADYIMKEYK